MKKLFVLIFSVLVLGMSCTRIDAGYVGLKVDLLGSEKGAVQEIPAGRYFNISPNVDYYKFPQFTQTYKWTEGKDDTSPNDEAIRFQTGEGLQITADIGISFNVNKEKGTASKLFLQYRRGIEELIDSVIRNKVRDTFMTIGSRYTADQIIGGKKDELLKNVESVVKDYFAPDIEIVSLSWLSSPRPPQQVIDALNEKVKATQIAIQRENEVRTAEAEAKKKVAEAQGRADSVVLEANAKAKATLVEAEAQAKANKLLSESMTDRLIQYEYIKAWDGKLPTVQGGSGTILDMRNFSK